LIDHVDVIVARIVDQSIKGAGYPICLAEAHLQAVVSEQDRRFWYETIRVELQRQDVTLTCSRKLARKRQIPL